MKKIENIEILDNIIVGRVEPKIYAFTTGTVPNHIKVGDTYRPLETRLDEWRKYFPNLEKKFDDVAKVNDEVFFRDHAVHYFLEHEIGKKRLKKGEIKNIPYSKEFFKSATEEDVESAIKDIKKGHKNNEKKYQYYSFDESLLPVTHTYKRLEEYKPRPNQKRTIEKFKEAFDSGRDNLLMYAVMRFGKSFTSMCCAAEIKASLVLIVSAKADVQEEWKKTVESHKKFADYTFLSNKDLLENGDAIKREQKRNKKVVIFLTLQDLQGKEIKKKHKEVFENKNKIDLLIIDETHFGARAEEYGRVLKDISLTSKGGVQQELRLNDESLDDLEVALKTLNAKVRLHLSGTPYRILMGSEFDEEDIIAFYQFSDIAQDQKAWDEKNLHKDETKEWNNPYYGFPQMVRFAFHPNESSRKKMDELKNHGISYTLSELLKPRSITKDTKNELHKQFKHEAEVLDLFKVIDGSKKDKNILNFLDYKKIQEGKMCRHIVCVLPYRASCDALESLLKNNEFRNFRGYEVINISGVEADKKYKTTQLIQSKIKTCEAKNKKTITLTVNRMLTGSTVPEWDTMLYFKDTASPQEYDQAVFRLQNQYIRTYTDLDGDTVKFNMKPQTLLVDFSPNRMFEMQEQKALIYNANIDKRGNTELKKQIQKELDISPIIVLNQNKIQKVTPADILDAVREYSKNRGIDDEARAIPIDTSVLGFPEIRAEIEKQNEIGSKQGLNISAVEGEEGGIDIEDKESVKKEKTGEDLLTTDKKIVEDFRKRFATFYMRILFLAFLTNVRVESLGDIIKAARNSRDNQRIIENLGINTTVLNLFQTEVSPFTLVELDRKIYNINSLANDKAVSPEERVKTAVKKFTRLSESEIVTPEFIADKIINILPEKSIRSSTKILDLASKQGEFVYAVYKKFGKEIANNVYSIPTSKTAYEFTRKMYESLGLNIDNIEKNYTSYQLIEDNDIIKGENVKINGTSMKFDVIVGNPPYQESVKGYNRQEPIYQHFYDIAESISEKYCLITPARFLFNAGLTQKSWNLKMLNNPHLKVVYYNQNSDEIFSNIDIKGGVVVINYDKNKNFGAIKNFVPNDTLRKVISHFDLNSELNFPSIMFGGRSDLKFNSTFLEDYPDSKVDRLSQIQAKHPEVTDLGPNEEYELKSSTFESLPYIFKEKEPKKIKDFYRILGLHNGKRVWRWVEKKYMTPRYPQQNNIEKWKVFIPKANGSGSFGETLSTTAIGGPSDTATPTFISIGSFDTKIEAKNVSKYMKTKLLRSLLGVLKITHDNPPLKWSYIPLQDFTSKSDIDWSKSISEIDKQLYKKYHLTKDEIEFIENNVKPMK